MFTLGVLELEVKAKVETVLGDLRSGAVHFRQSEGHVPEEIATLEDQMSDQYVCNFSVFQNLLDHWAIGQLFPIMPLQRLDERPTGGDWRILPAIRTGPCGSLLIWKGLGTRWHCIP